jgi:hypothetical protein
MTIKELKEFIKDCNDNDIVTVCSHPDDNPVTDYCLVKFALKLTSSGNLNISQICLMPL